MPNTTEKLISVPQLRLSNAFMIPVHPTYGFQANNANQLHVYYILNTITLNPHLTLQTTPHSIFHMDPAQWKVSGAKIPSLSEEFLQVTSMSEKPQN